MNNRIILLNIEIIQRTAEMSPSQDEIIQIPGSFPSGGDIHYQIRIPIQPSSRTMLNPDSGSALQSRSTPILNHQSIPSRDFRIPLESAPESYTYYPPPQEYRPRYPSKTLFRYKTQLRIPLTQHGNLVVDVPVPQKILEVTTDSSAAFTHLRYSAVVADPDDFSKEGYTLRQSEDGQQTEIFIVVTMYNENQELFLRTWNSLNRNIQFLCSKKGTKVWGKDGW
jgi:hypothetical protein